MVGATATEPAHVTPDGVLIPTADEVAEGLSLGLLAPGDYDRAQSAYWDGATRSHQLDDGHTVGVNAVADEVAGLAIAAVLDQLYRRLLGEARTADTLPGLRRAARLVCELAANLRGVA
jgi:hypothetical protein